MSPRLLTFVVAFAAFLGPFTQTVYAPILPELGGALRTTPFLINLSISIFTLVLAFMQIIYGPLVDRSGRKRTLLAGLAIYIVASLGCFLADRIETLLAFRALQAVGIAAGAVVAVTVIGDRFEGAARGRAMGSFQMMVALGPVVGPVVGGFVGEHLDFHYVFLLLALVGAAALLSNAIWLRETRPAGEPRAFHPAQYLEVLGNRQGLAIMLLSFVQYYAFYNYLVFMPRVLDAVYGLSASEKGLVFLPLSVAVVIGSYVGGRLLGHWRPRPMLLVTALLNALSLLLFLAVAPLSLVALVVAVTAFGLFLGLSLPVQTSLLMDLYQHNRATAVGSYNFFRFMGMATTGPVLGSWLFQDGNLGLLYGFAAAAFLLAVGNAQLRFRRG